MFMALHLRRGRKPILIATFLSLLLLGIGIGVAFG
jgi:hypothetical protein